MMNSKLFKLSFVTGLALCVAHAPLVYAQEGNEIPQIILDPLDVLEEEPAEELLSDVPESAPVQVNITTEPASTPPAVEPEPAVAEQEIITEPNLIEIPDDVPEISEVEEVNEPPQENLVDLDQQVQPPPAPKQTELIVEPAEQAAPQIVLQDPEEDLFYDADSLVPTGEIAVRGAVKKVDPRVEPASRFVIVNKAAKSDSVEARLVAASRAIKLGRYESALDIYNMMHKKNKRDPRVLMGRAIALQHLDRFDEAMQAYEAFSKVDKDNIEARVNMLGLLATKFPAVAQQRLETLLDENPGHVGLLAQLAMTKGKQGDFSSAMRYLGVAASLEPKNAAHVYNMGVVADRAGQRKQAISMYEQALDLDTTYGRGQSIPRDVILDRLAVIR